MSETVVRDNFSRGEAVWGIVWLCIGAAVSVLLEVVYLGATVFGVPLPMSIVVAFLFNAVLTRTALLWASIRAIALIPLAVWVGVFLILLAVLPASGTMLVPNNILTVVLMFAGLAGGVWPVLKR
ncbi:hypothetical protein ACUY28_09075 [Corynebacterium sanguinis]|uniref:Uncharacterized protein n=1 Tax=Corynebacterium sanguinis TaxID=2594913 RepID=A0A6C1TXI5_9CORY|nr:MULTISPECIES: hypothetical protein [Corynebacterium]MBA4503806.1 hypothetical protein [Corynebacterium sanguinis]MCT1412321.1 hypothetical protein [Corynebacterium sanguinis]MCT1413984.1 hypothetical protein [Corynebacterium sanguinis]MCT1425888.1 hypothetical protein [Corynebacterium sanguinis]MCT1444514.1 hypothetical protein [Corynebacterium sanguinis]